MQCPACGRENREDARFCDGCGAAAQAACPSCGRELRPDARFCDGCGGAVGATASAGASAQPEAPERSPRDYTPKHLAEKILQSQSALRGERKQVTVMFADLQGSMELAEQIGAEEWHRILDRFFEILSEGVHRFEGTVNQYTGDGIMALFGAPIAHEDHAQRACFAALHLKGVLRDYADELRRTVGISISTRIGLNSGEVVVGKIGDDLRMDYTAQGHTVGLAQRMESRAAPDCSYLTEHTARLVEGYFELRDLGPFELKGVSGAIQVYALEGLGEVRTRLDRSRAQGFSRFVGRADELDVLERALEGATLGRGGIVGVVAQAGVGKSRLCLEFVEQCRARGVTVYEAHCPSHGRAVPLLPVFELLRGSFGLHEGEGDQAAREKIAGRLLLLDREFEPLLPLTFDFLGVADPEQPLGSIDPAMRQRQLLALTRRLVQARSEREPAVMLIDDVHWMDPASEVFLESLAETVPGTRTLLLLNFRPEYSAEWMARSTYQQLPLHPLGDTATDLLLADLLGTDPSLAPLRPLVRERSGGNPFYVEEIVQNLREAGSLVGERGALRLAAPVARLEVPNTVQAILAARIDRLPEREKHLLQTAAAIGRRFPEPLLRSVCGLRDDEFGEAMRSLSRGEFIYEEAIYPEVEYAFRHPLTHEVAERSQLADRRRTVHAAVARELERLHEGSSDEQAALLAHHWDEAGEPTAAALWHRRAAEWIAGSNAHEASRHWQRVLELSGEIADEALADELGERARLMVLEFSWRIGAGEEETDALFAEGLAWAQGRQDAHALAAINNAYSMAAILVHGRTARAEEVTEEGLRQVAQTDDRPLAFALEIRGYLIADFICQLDDMERRMARMHAFSREEMEAASPILGYHAPTLAIGYQGNPCLYSGRFEAALDFYRQGLEEARAHDAVEVASWIQSYFCDALIGLGDLERATAAGQEALQLAERTESPVAIGMAASSLALVLALRGEHTEARAIATLSVEQCRLAGVITVPEALAILARCQLAEGERQAARETAEEALAKADEMLLLRGRKLALLALARVAAEGSAQEREEAAGLLDQAEQLAATSGCRYRLPEVWEIRSELATRAGDAAAAAQHLERAAALHQEFGALLEVERLERAG
jgi:class 3 adenylate cyclase/tetratricopeptide (TPR) repeat protein